MITFSLDPILVIQFVIAVFLPVLVGLVTTRVTSGAWKAILLALFTLVTSLLTELVNALSNGLPYDLGVGLMLALPAFVISVSMHYGLWKPTGVSQTAQGVLNRAPE